MRWEGATLRSLGAKHSEVPRLKKKDYMWAQLKVRDHQMWSVVCLVKLVDRENKCFDVQLES